MAQPWVYYEALSEPRLRLIAGTLLDVLYDTTLELDTPLDDAYTRGSATFGRQRNALIRLCQSGDHPWLRLVHGGMDVTFEIGSVPCRFFSDDPQNPKKPGYWKRNESDQLFSARPGDPEVFRFVVEKETPEGESDVYFVGYDAQQQEVFRWRYSASVPTLAATDHELPREVDLPPAQAKLPRKPASSDDAKRSGEPDGQG